MYMYSITPVAGTATALPISRMASGFPICQPVKNSRGLGASLGSPSFAPPSTQETTVSISFGVMERSFEKWPYFASANHGGIFFAITASLMAFANGRASL